MVFEKQRKNILAKQILEVEISLESSLLNRTWNIYKTKDELIQIKFDEILNHLT